MRPNKLVKLFLRSLMISATTVGGGYVILSVLRRHYTVRKNVIPKEEMTDIAAVSQTAPGAVAVNASLLVGYRLCGVPGALVSVLGILIPPVAVMSALFLLGNAVRDIPALSGLMLGMRAGAAAVILDTALDLTGSALASASFFRTAAFAAALALCLFTDVGPVPVLLAAAAFGAVRTCFVLLKENRTGTAPHPARVRSAKPENS